MMINMKRACIAVVAATGLVFAVAAQAGSLPAPIVTIQQMAKNVTGALKKNKARLKSRPVLNSIVNTYFMPYINKTRMAQMVVGRNFWNNASATQQQQFIAQFKNMVVSTYAAALASYDNDKIRIYPLRGGVSGKTMVQVKTAIVRQNGQVIPISYSMNKVGGNWKVYDFSVENISMVNSYRSQFAATLSKSGMNGLIKQLQQHNSTQS